VSSDAPLLLVDVDGVLSLFGFDAGSPPPGTPALIDGMPHWLSKQAADVLNRLTARFEPVWCTGWEDRADENLPWLLGLPKGWPHIALKAARGPGRGVAGHWKLHAIDQYAGPKRPLAWIDDDLDEACTEWAEERPGATLLVHVDPRTGLTATHEAAIEAWRDTLETLTDIA